MEDSAGSVYIANGSLRMDEVKSGIIYCEDPVEENLQGNYCLGSFFPRIQVLNLLIGQGVDLHVHCIQF